MMQFNVNPDGSYAITAGSIRLTDCYPGINGTSIRPLRVSYATKDGRHLLAYETVHGTISLTLYLDNQTLVIESSLALNNGTVHWFHPFFRATVKGLRGLYRQGKGITGPSGYVSLATFKRNDDILKMFTSHGMTALVGEDLTIAAYAATHDRFSTQFHVSKLDREDYRELMSAGFEVEGVNVTGAVMPSLRFAPSDTLENGLNAATSDIAQRAGVSLRHEPKAVWCSWYYLYHNLSQSILSEYLKEFAKVKPALPFKRIQIDAGYFPSAGDWLESNSLWPKGLQGAFDEIKSYGLEVGIWIGPYMVGSRSRLFKEHPEWMLRRNDDKPVTAMLCYDEHKMWGYRDEEFYVIDTSNPAAMEYLRIVFRTLRLWGATYFKTDFMLWGMQDSSRVKRFSPGKTSVEYFIDLLKVIREEIGPESFWLGCIAPFHPFLGYADGMRIAGDVGARWSGEFGAENLIREVVGSNHLNHVYWQNDPDAMMLRNFHLYLKPVEVESLCLLQAVSGGVVATSDPMHEVSQELRTLVRLVEPHGRMRPSVPFLDQDRKEIVLVHHLGNGRHLLFFFNPGTEPFDAMYQLAKLGVPRPVYVRRWNDATCGTTTVEAVGVSLQGHGCALYFASEDGPVDGEIRSIWEW